MIKNKLILTLPVAAFVMLAFSFNSNKRTSFDENKQHSTLNTIPLRNKSALTFNFKKIRKPLLNKSKRKLVTNKNFSKKYAAAVQNKKNTTTTSNIKKTAKKDKKKGTKAKKDAKSDKKEILANNTNKPQAGFNKTTANKKAGSDPSISFNSTITTSTFTPTAFKDNDDEFENDNIATRATTGQTTRDEQVEDLSLFTLSYFKNLLAERKLNEFEQALKLELSIQQRTTAYVETLKVLFNSEISDPELEAFVQNNFINHRTAISIARSFSDPSLSIEQIEFSIRALNQLVISWDIESGDPTQFNTIYEVAVLSSIPENDQGSNDIFSSLQDSIEITALNISESGVEVAAI